MSFVAYRVTQRDKLFLSGVLYTLGRSITYAVVGFLIVGTVTSIPVLSSFLSLYINKILGFVLILAGMHLLKLLPVRWAGFSVSDTVVSKIGGRGFLSPLLLGMVFALAFCPVATAILFGSLIPLAIKANSSIALPVMYGLGTGAPVLVFSILAATGVEFFNRAYRRVSQIGNYTKTATGVVFILVGIYYVLSYDLGLF